MAHRMYVNYERDRGGATTEHLRPLEKAADRLGETATRGSSAKQVCDARDDYVEAGRKAAANYELDVSVRDMKSVEAMIDELARSFRDASRDVVRYWESRIEPGHRVGLRWYSDHGDEDAWQMALGRVAELWNPRPEPGPDKGRWTKAAVAELDRFCRSLDLKPSEKIQQTLPALGYWLPKCAAQGLLEQWQTELAEELYAQRPD